MAGVFKVVVSCLFAAMLASYNEPRGAQDWATRYTELVSQSPIDDDPAVVRLSPYPAAKGVYKHNDKLQSLTKLGEGELLLPEDVQPDPTGAFLYVTNQDGWIRKYYLATAKVENWTYVGGRPLGLALDNAANLIVCESGQNQLIQISKDTGVKTILSTEAEGVKYGLIDEVIVASDGLIYFTDGTYKYPLTTWWYDLLEGKPHGRVLVYDPKTNTTSVVVKNIQFANGVALSKSEDYLLYCESTTARVTKLHLKGSNKGKSEVFIDNLPGHPDNIHRNKAGDRFYLALLFNRNALYDFVFKTPVLKLLLAWDEKLYSLWDNSPSIARVVELDEEGKPLRVFEDSTGKVIAMVTTALPSSDGHYLYVGGLRDNFVGRFSLEST